MPSEARARSLANLRVGGGRAVGVPNKLGASIKQMVERALHDVGGAQYLARQAEENPVAFLGLVGKVMPMQLIENADANTLTALHLIAARQIADQMQLLIASGTKPNGHANGNGAVIDGDAVIDYTKPALE